MSESFQISFSDVRVIARLLGECRELGDDPLAWRLHFYATLGNLVGADLVIGGEMSGCMRVAAQVPGSHAAAGQTFAENPPPAEMWRAQLDSLRAAHGKSIVITRAQGHAGSTWVITHDEQLLVRAMESASCLHSLQPTSEAGNFDSLSLCRPQGEPRFSQREAVLVAMLHCEVARLIGGPLAETLEATPSQLSQRVRQVLNCMLQGESDKQIAASLNLSPHTINQHTKRIFLHFKVNSRSELLGRWISRNWGLHSNIQPAAEAAKLE